MGRPPHGIFLGPCHYEPCRLFGHCRIDARKFPEAAEPVEDRVAMAEKLLGRQRNVPGPEKMVHCLDEPLPFDAAAVLQGFINFLREVQPGFLKLPFGKPRPGEIC